MNKLLITGCNGNLASYLIQHIDKKNNIKIIGCDLQEKLNFVDGVDPDNIIYKKTDLRSIDSINELIDFLKENDFFPNIIINNAALDSVPNTNNYSDAIDIENFHNFFNVNLKAPILLFKLLSEHWIKNNISGNVINISSIYSKVSPDPSLYSKGFIKNILYGTSKSSLNNAFKQLSVIYANKNIRMNSLILAGIESPTQSLEFKEKYINRIPIQRFLKFKEILPALELLLNENNSYMTGSEILIDGGYTNI
tara:strand:+ start:133 stop:888 length:756 start_codon:yes stop_codon:yes gene_type:complete